MDNWYTVTLENEKWSTSEDDWYTGSLAGNLFLFPLNDSVRCICQRPILPFDEKYGPLSGNAFSFSLNGSVRCINSKGAYYLCVKGSMCP